MDDNKFDKILKKRLDGLTEANYGVEGWEQVSGAIFPSSNKTTGLKKLPMILATGIAICLLISNIFTIKTLKGHERRIDELNQMLSLQTDSLNMLFAYQAKEIGPNSEDGLRSINAMNQINNLTKPENKKANRLTNGPTKAINSFTLSNPKNINEKVINGSRSNTAFSSFTPNITTIPYATPNNTISQSIPIVTNPRYNPTSTFAQNTISIKKKKSPVKARLQKIDLSKILSTRGHRIGISIDKPAIYSDLGKSSVSLIPGLLFDLRLRNNDWRIQGGVKWLSLKLDTDDLNNIESIKTSLLRYPNIDKYYELKRLHEVHVANRALEFPLLLKYQLQTGRELSYFIQSGIQSRLYLSQKFKYEYLESIENRPTISERSGVSFSPVSFILGTGAEIRVNRKARLELGVQYMGDLSPQGIENRKYHMVGFRSALLFGKR